VVLLNLDLKPIEGAHTLPDLGHDLWAWVLTRLNHTHNYVNLYKAPDMFAG
jgi:hypothetical protein